MLDNPLPELHRMTHQLNPTVASPQKKKGKKNKQAWPVGPAPALSIQSTPAAQHPAT
jgi:hypothetical protein